MNRSSKKAKSPAMHDAQVGEVLTKLREWAYAERELYLMLNHTATSVVIRCRVVELKEGTFTFFEPDGRVSVLASIPSFSCVAMSTGDTGTCMHLATRFGEGLTIFDKTCRREDLFDRFPATSSTVQ